MKNVSSNVHYIDTTLYYRLIQKSISWKNSGEKHIKKYIVSLPKQTGLERFSLGDIPRWR